MLHLHRIRREDLVGSIWQLQLSQEQVKWTVHLNYTFWRGAACFLDRKGFNYPKKNYLQSHQCQLEKASRCRLAETRGSSEKTLPRLFFSSIFNAISYSIFISFAINQTTSVTTGWARSTIIFQCKATGKMEGLTKQQLAEKSGSYRIFTCLGTKLKIKGCSENTSLYRNAQENLSNSVTICKLHKDRPWFRSQQKKLKIRFRTDSSI